METRSSRYDTRSLFTRGLALTATAALAFDSQAERHCRFADTALLGQNRYG